MVKNVLIVDDDQEMLTSLENGLMKYKESFSVLIAQDGLDAVEKLKNKIISLVVTDLKMPRMDGFALLQHIIEHYPDIPVIIITGYSTPEMERLAKKGGAIGYIAKPFILENLARNIMATLRRESEGGTLHSVSSGIFLQLMEMEQKTCTIRLEDKNSGQKGVLFFKDGCWMPGSIIYQGKQPPTRFSLGIKSPFPFRMNAPIWTIKFKAISSR
jgi:DNA-binding response OmpR family regulator